MPVRRLDSGRLVVEFEQGGKRVFRRVPRGATHADAKAYETKLRRDLFATDRLGVPPEVSIAAALKLYLDGPAKHQKDAHRTRLRSHTWADHIEGKTLRQAPEVAKTAAASWMSELAPGTINRRLALLKAVLKWAYHQALIDQNLSGRIRLLPEDGAREVYLSRAQVAALARHAPSSASRAAIMLAAYTGLRADELLAQVPPIRRHTLAVASRKSKTGKPRLVPVPERAQKYLRALPLPLTYWQLNKEFNAARKAAGLEHVRFHDLRHTTASWLINSGEDLYTIGRILGHSTPLTTARYAHLSHRSLRRAMRKL
jgi:integrase